MNYQKRIDQLEQRLDQGAAGKPFFIVDRGEGPLDPQQREAWIQSKIPAGTTDVTIVRVIREHLAQDGEQHDNGGGLR